MNLSNNLLQHLTIANETIIFTNERGEPAFVVLPYQKYLQFLNGADSHNKDGLTSDNLLDKINFEIAERREQLPLINGDDSVIVDTDEDEEEQLYLEDIEVKN